MTLACLELLSSNIYCLLILNPTEVVQVPRFPCFAKKQESTGNVCPWLTKQTINIRRLLLRLLTRGASVVIDRRTTTPARGN